MSTNISTKNIKIQILFILSSLKFSICQYPGNPRCSNKLENALELILRRNEMKSNSRTLIDLSPYSIYHPLYDGSREGEINPNENDEQILSNKIRNNFYENFSNMDNTDNNGDDLKQLPIQKVEVTDLKVRLPNNMRWVQVDKCHFNASNRTLDTRLLFPDLTISGKVILHPTGGRCNMILRLRRAGIEFRTIPITTSGHDESLRSGAASVRTDSHFAEPGFLSVFAHGCQGPYGLKVRQNSKRRQFDTNRYHNQHHHNMNIGKWSRYDNIDRYDYSNDNQGDFIEFNDDVLDGKNTLITNESKMLKAYNDDSKIIRNYKKYHKHHNSVPQQNLNQQWHNIERPTNSNDVNEILIRELEKLFSMGVRGLLTTYMQKALQPAIKETLMQNMGYTISYG